MVKSTNTMLHEELLIRRNKQGDKQCRRGRQILVLIHLGAQLTRK